MAKTKKKKTPKKTITTIIATVDYSKPLKSSKYERFCQEYNKDSNATKAAIGAKYSKKTAAVKGSQLLRIVSIKKRIAHLQRKVADKAGVTAEKITAEFKKIAFGKASKKLTYKNKISALENLGKHIGYYEADNEQRKDNLADFLRAFKE